MRFLRLFEQLAAILNLNIVIIKRKIFIEKIKNINYTEIEHNLVHGSEFGTETQYMGPSMNLALLPIPSIIPDLC